MTEPDNTQRNPTEEELRERAAVAEILRLMGDPIPVLRFLIDPTEGTKQ